MIKYIIAILIYISLFSYTQASVVFQNYPPVPGGSNALTATDLGGSVQYGGGQRFTATSSFPIESIEYYVSKSGSVSTGCLRGYIMDNSYSVLATSSNCVDSSMFPTLSDYATTTFSFNRTEILSGNTYVISVIWEGTTPVYPDYISMEYNSLSGYGDRCAQLGGLWSCATPNSPYIFRAYDTGGITPSATNTRIISFTPEEGTTTTSNIVMFSLDSYVNSQDVSGISKVELRLQNIDQNALISTLSDYTILLYEENVDAGGYYSFSTSTYLANGNYRVEARIRKNIFGFSTGEVITDAHQFIVGSSTFIGNISQNSFNAINAIFGITESTSTLALSNKCKPLGDWDTIGCLAFLFIPDAGMVKQSIVGTLDIFVTRFPVGYLTRFVNIVTDDNLVPLPSFTAEIMLGSTSSTTLTFDPSEMLSGANTLLTDTRDPFHGKNIRDVTEPMVQLTFALLVLLYIITDLTTKRHEADIGQDSYGKSKPSGLKSGSGM